MTEQFVERFDPENLALEDHSKVAGERFGHLVQVELAAKFALHRSHRFRRDAAGDDQIEEAEVGVYVEGEAVRGDEAGDVHANGCEFGFGPVVGRARFASLDSRGGCPHMSIAAFGIGPDTGEASHAFGWDTEIGAGANEYLFQTSDEFDCAESLALAFRRGESAQIKDGIADDLPGPVKRNVPATVAFEKLDATISQEFGGSDHIRCLRVTSERDDGFMLKQNQEVTDFIFFAQGDQLLLQTKCSAVVDGSELDDRDQGIE